MRSVRPAILDDKPTTGKVVAVTDLTGIDGGSIARANVANFCVSQLTSDEFLHGNPLSRSGSLFKTRKIRSGATAVLRTNAITPDR